MDQHEVAEIVDFVKDGKYPVSMKKDKKRNFRRKCESFVFDGELYYQRGSSKRLKVIKKGETKDIIKSIHATDHGGHLGISKTWEKVSTRFYWKGSYEEVKKYIKNCDKCQRKGNLKKAKKPVRSIPVPQDAFKQVGMDLIGPLETTSNEAEVCFEVGDQLLIHNTKKTTRKGGKLKDKWKGPYRITKVTGKGTYFVEGLKTSVSGNRLARYITGTNDSGSSTQERNPKCKETNSNNEKSAHETSKIEHNPKHKEAKNNIQNRANENSTNESDRKNNEKRDNIAFEGPTKEQDKSDCNLPIKKRKISGQDQPTASSTSNFSELEPFQFNPVNKDWQDQASSLFQSKVRNPYITGRDRFIRRDAKPSRMVSMRGDGSCIFRAFSYLVFGVQSYHRIIRQTIVAFIKENENIMKSVMQGPVARYLDMSKMADDKTWGTEVEIFAFSTITRTIVYVYSQYGDNCRWLEYKPLTNANRCRRAIFLQNISEHFVPVLEVEGEEFSRKPYIRIRNYIPGKYHSLVSDDMLDAALVNSHADEALLAKTDKSVTTVYMKAFTNTKYDVEGLQGLSEKVNANIFNLVCDWDDAERKLN